MDNVYLRSCKTATDKEYEVAFMASSVIGVTSILYIEFIKANMVDIVTVFSNPEETSYIRGFVNGEQQRAYRGYTHLIEANIQADTGNLRIALTAQVDVM